MPSPQPSPRGRGRILGPSPRGEGDLGYFYSHGAGGARDDFFGGFDVEGVEILHLDLGDLADLGARDGADLDLLGVGRTKLQAEGLLDEIGGWRRLGDEREGAVLEDGDLDGDDRAIQAGGALVVLLDELHECYR